MPSVDLLLEQGHAAEEAGNYAHARVCFEQGAALGDETCWMRLGYLFDVGIGVAVDRNEAEMLSSGMENPRTGAASNIAILYRERGNRRAMFQWFQRAAGEGDGDAQVDVAKCYLSGKGVRRNPQSALRWLAAAQGNNNITEAAREEAEIMLSELRPRLA